MVSLATVRFLTELLDAEEVGQYYLLLTLLALFNFVFFNPVGQYYGRSLIRWKHQGDVLNATVIALLLRFLGVLFCIVILVAIFTTLDYTVYYKLSEFLLFFLLSLLAGIHGVLLSAVNILGDRLRFTIIGSLTLIVGLLLSLVIVSSIHERAIGWLYGIAISQIIFSILLFKCVVKDSSLSINKLKSALDARYLRNTLYFLIPISLTLFLQWGQNVSYRIIVEAKYSIEVLAYLGIGMAIANNIFNAVESLVNQIYTPVYFKDITHSSRSGRSAAWNQLAFHAIPIYIVLATLVLCTSLHLPVVLTSEKFHGVSLFIALGVLVEFLRVSTNLVYMISQSEMRTVPTVLPYAIGFLITITSLLVFDVSTNIWLIAILLSIAYVVILLLLWINMRKLLQVQIDVARLFRAILASLPLSLLIIIPTGVEGTTKTFLISLGALAIGGIYFCVVVYVMMQSKFEAAE